jgi:hypothetical protein
LKNHVGSFFDRYSTSADAILFLVIVGVGLLIQLLFRGVLDFSAWLVSLLLIMLMSLYAYLVRFNTATKTGSDRSGDTIYFLGFIFTTVTLGIALFKVGGSERDFATSIVLSDLGVGIATTIWGLILRVVFSLSRVGIEEVEDRTIASLNKQSRSLSGKLQRASQIAEETTIKTQQVLDETEKALDLVAVKMEGRFSDIYKETYEKLQLLILQSTESMEKLYQKIDEVEVPTDLIHKKIENSFGMLDSSLSSFEEKVNNMKISEDFIELKIDAAVEPLTRSINEIADSVGKLQSNVSSLSGLNLDMVSSASIELEGLNEEFAKLRTKLSDQSFDNRLFERHIENAGTEYEKAVQGLSEKISSMVMPEKHLLEIIDNSFSHYHSFVKETSESIEKDTLQLNHNINEVKNSLGGLSIAIEETSVAIKGAKSSGSLLENIFRRST